MICPVHRTWKIRGLGRNEVALAVVQKNRDEVGIQKRSNDEIGKFVPIHILRSNLKPAGRPDDADGWLVSGAEVKVDRILRTSGAIAGDTDKSQIELPVAVKIRDGKLRGAKRDCRADETRDGPVRIAEMQLTCANGCDKAEERHSRKKKSIGDAAQAHKQDLVYRTSAWGWQCGDPDGGAGYTRPGIGNSIANRAVLASSNVLRRELTFWLYFPLLGTGAPEFTVKITLILLILLRAPPRRLECLCSIADCHV